MNIALIDQQGFTAKSLSSTRFGAIYKIIGKSPIEIENLSKTLREEADRKKLEIAIANLNNRENETLVFTQEPADLKIGRFFENFPSQHNEYLKNFRNLCAKFKQIWKNSLNEHQEEVFKNLQYSVTNVDDVNFRKEFKKQFEIFEDVGPISKRLVNSVKTLLPYKFSSKNDLDFMIDIQQAFETLKSHKQALRADIRNKLLRFNLANDKRIDFYLLKSDLNWELRHFEDQKPLKAYDVKRWLENGSFDIVNGQQESLLKRLFYMFKKSF